MKYLGIDYGTKKIGTAISDSEGNIAFPRDIIANSPTVISELVQYIESEGIETVVVGKSLDPWGDENTVQQDIDRFVSKLSEATQGIQIIQQDERGSSVAARSHLYSKGNIANERWTEKENQKKREAVDAGAAAIILQRYLDTRKRA
jgi:putative Holliday junction resolvase